MRVLRLLIICILLSPVLVQAQIGTEFWFAAPDASEQHYSSSVPLNLHITALYNTHVVISRPADPGFTPIEFDLTPQQTQLTRLDAVLAVDEIEVYARDISAGNFIQNKGFLIESYPGEVTAYYELEGKNNTDIVALKSNNALGTDFWVSTQRKYKNHGYSDDFSGFVVVATDDGTIVDIDPNSNNLEHHGSSTFSVTLQKGETFAVRAAGQAPAQHIFGVKVHSNKDIAITIFDDSMQIDDGYGNWDIFADQLVPIGLIGLEYIVMKGNVQDSVAIPNDGEAVFFTSTEDNTDIYIDDVFLGNMVSAGDYLSYDIKNLSTHIRSTKPIYVNHITGYSTDASGARELGGAILPSIDKCTGSHSVTVKRTPAPGFIFFNNLMVRNDTVTGSPTQNKAIHNFTYSIDGAAALPINPNHFTYIMDSAFAVYDRTKAGGGAYYNSVNDNEILRVENPIARFHLGVMQGKQSPGCKYGYFSDYAASDASAGIGGSTFDSDFFCNLNPIQLVANGGTSYKWYTPFDALLVNQLDYDSVATPYFFPDTTGVYYFNVIVTGECQSKDTIATEIIVGVEASTNFTFSADEGCSPFAPTLTNFSDTLVGVTQLWTIETAATGAYQINQDTIPMVYDLLLPENHTDSIQVHTVKLIVKGAANSCPTQREKDIKVLPQLKADFSIDDTIGCHPLFINLSNLSTGNVDSASYTWDFGDNSQSFNLDPSHSYGNFGLSDTLYTIQLLAESPFGCLDSIADSITVHPRVRTAMAIETAASCSPLNISIDPGNSIGVDTFHWHVDYVYADSIYITQSDNPITMFHQDTSLISGPDTLRINLWGINRMGCVDSFPERNVVVYPEVNANYDIDIDEICDGDSINFTNNSTGYQLFYSWDFNDGTVVQDTTGTFYPRHGFYNRSDIDSSYNVTLTATSGYFCEDIKDTLITVHPFIRANFGLEYSNNCTPLLASFSDLSVRAHFYEWDYGDGSLISTADDSLFTHLYWNNSPSNDTSYTITLVTENNEGCTDTLTRALNIFPHVVAAFDLTDTVGCSPLPTTFSNNSTGGLLSYLWDYGNSTSSTNSSPSFGKTYTNLSQNDTVYHISLTTSNPYGCDSTVYDSITVFASIDAEFNLPLADSCSPFILRPENLSSIGAKVYEWDFLGNGFSSGDFEPVVPAFVNTNLVYDTITARLIAYGLNDPLHRACADTHSIQVFVYPELDVDFNLDNLSDCQPLISNISNTTNLPSGNTFEWNIDSTFYSALRDPPSMSISNLNNYDETHILKLSGESQYGCRDTMQQSVTVYSLVDARFTVNKAGICSADSFQIDRRTSRGGITTYEWDFGSVIENKSDSMFYYSYANTINPSPVNQPIKLTVYNSHACLDTITKNVDVYPEVRANFGVDINSFCYPHNSEFTNTTENANNFFWDFGDGSGSNDQIPEAHVFDNFDKATDITYDIQLIARSQYNCYDSISDQVTVFAKPEAQFYFPVTVDCPPFNAQMINESQGFDPSYLWDFGDGNTSVDESPTNLFVNNGSAISDVPIKLTVTSGGAKACVDTAVRVLRVYPNVLVDFQTSLTEGCSPLSVIFTGDTTNISTMVWDIDGLPFSTLLNTSYRFVNPSPDNESFDVTFRGTSLYNCTTDTTLTITVYPAPQAEFIPNPIVQPYNTELDQTLVTFFNQTAYQDNWTYEWNYGDGITDNQSGAVFDYFYGDHFWGKNENGNEVPVSLTTWNTNNPECRDSVSYKIQIKPPPPQVALEEDIAGCEPFTLDFGSVVKYIYEDQMEWDFGVEGATASGSAPVYTYEEQGTYTVRLQVNGEGGSSWAYRVITVHPKPEINFMFNDSFALVTSQNSDDEYINFYNQTKFGNEYWWFFENNLEDGLSGANSTEKDPSWHFENIGTYYAALVSMSTEGCYDTLVSTNAISIQGEASIQFPTGFIVEPSGPADEYVSDPMDPRRTIFRPYAKGVDEYKLEVYNRWGVMVFQTDDVNRGWNGYIDGIAAKQDVYIWRAKGRFTNGQPFEMSGDVTLIVAPDGQVPH